ncbi:hypothetical protein ACTG9Q_28530 [Actinokineospora sp. 24-640]
MGSRADAVVLLARSPGVAVIISVVALAWFLYRRAAIRLRRNLWLDPTASVVPGRLLVDFRWKLEPGQIATMSFRLLPLPAADQIVCLHGILTITGACD